MGLSSGEQQCATCPSERAGDKVKTPLLFVFVNPSTISAMYFKLLGKGWVYYSPRSEDKYPRFHLGRKTIQEYNDYVKERKC